MPLVKGDVVKLIRQPRYTSSTDLPLGTIGKVVAVHGNLRDSELTVESILLTGQLHTYEVQRTYVEEV